MRAALQQAVKALLVVPMVRMQVVAVAALVRLALPAALLVMVVRAHNPLLREPLLFTQVVAVAGT